DQNDAGGCKKNCPFPGKCLHEFHKRLLLLEFLKLMGIYGVLMHFLTGKTVGFCGKTWDF
ncbi:MAG: hypothetical protein UEE32_00225, partial [Oscillospiraceae bacterium]|nr:hypothetical protein [Oscillospiraceae bacterium]